MQYKFLIHEENKQPVAELYYDTDTEKYSIQIYKDVNPRDMPVILMLAAEKGQYELDDRITRMFVKERVIPAERQNIGSILKDYGFAYYDEILFLIADRGYCCMDEFYVDKVN